jgi:cytochrome c-type biogenesis protein CcmF
MWWVLLLALFSALAIYVNRERHRELIPYVTAIISFGFVIYRLPLLRSRNELDSWVSREFAFLVNNWILLSAAFFVLTATLFPTLSEWVTKERITVGPPFFTKWMTPIGLTLLFLTGVGPLIAWRKASVENLKHQFAIPTGAALTTLVLLSAFKSLRVWSRFLSDKIQLPLSLICFALCAFVFVTIGQEFYRGTRVRQTHTKLDFFTSLIGLVARGKRRYGGYLVHLAVVLMFIGFAGDAYKKETEVTLERGQTVSLDRYTVRFDGLRRDADAQKQMTIADLTVLVGGKEYAKMAPAKWAYRHHEDEPPTTEVDIVKTAKEDLYLILNGFDGEQGIANIKVVINPLVSWIWVGFVLLALGTFVAFLPDRAYALAGQKVKSAGPGAAGAVATLLLFASLAAGGLARAQAPPEEHPTTAQPATSGMAPSRGLDLHTPRNERERGLFDQLRCLCGDCLHSLNECGGECGAGAKRRAEIQAQLDGGKSNEEVTAWEVDKYGQQVLRVPLDKGFNRLAWVLPYGAILFAVGGLVLVARKWTRPRVAAIAPAAATTTTEASVEHDAEYASKLDDALDELD